jgi:tRNA pseudouridine55 synthase
LEANDYAEGACLLVDKPLDWTSFDVVSKIKFALKSQFGKIKIGHAGTLDPKATGLLIICTGKWTKRIDEYQNADKVYTGTLMLGATTECYDSEREINATFPTDHITESMIHECAQSFIGAQEQFPPAHSAIKIDGKTAYNLARKGKEVVLKSRPITIYDFKITGINMPYVDFEVKCTKGTYIRSLAHDFGQKLNSGAYLTALRRTQSGDIKVEDAWKLEELISFIRSQKPDSNADSQGV